MSLINPFTMANRNGIPRIEATGVTVSDSAVTFSFQKNAFYNRAFSGLLILKLIAFTVPTTAVPILFNTNGASQTVLGLNGEALTSANLNQSGIYLAFYDGDAFQILTGV